MQLLSEELKPYEVDDLLGLEKFHSLNLVPNANGVLTPFITKLPPKLSPTTPYHQEETKDNKCKSKVLQFKEKVV